MINFKRFNYGFKFIGESVSDKDFLITTHSYLRTEGHLYILDYKGNVKLYKRLPCFAMDFKQLPYNNGFTYNLCKNGYGDVNGWYELSEVIITDNKLNEIKKLKLLPNKTIQTNLLCQCHDNLILDENHYFLLGINAQNVKIDNKPTRVLNCTIQEQKDGKVIWQFDTIDYPELFEYSNVHNYYFNSFNRLRGIAEDYAHMNSIALTSDRKHLYISLRNIGIIKVNYETKKIEWVIGHKYCSLDTTPDMIMPKWQHDIRLQDDDTFTIFDNYGTENARVLKIQVKDNKITKYEQLVTEREKSRAMGGAIEVAPNIYDICYGAFRPNTVLEEYDFNNRKQLMKFDFNNRDFMYRVERGNYEA